MKYLLLILILLMFNACIKEDASCPDDFIMNGNVEPYQENYKLGDTISLIIDSDINIWDKNTKEYYDLSTINIGCLFTTYNLSINSGSNTISTVTNNVLVIDDSLYKPTLKTFLDESQIVFSNLLLINGRFKTKLQFIPIDTGSFMLSFGPFLIQNTQSFIGKCKNSKTYLSTRLNEGKDNNIDLLKTAVNSQFALSMITPPEKFYETKQGFAYRVVE